MVVLLRSIRAPNLIYYCNRAQVCIKIIIKGALWMVNSRMTSERNKTQKLPGHVVG